MLESPQEKPSLKTARFAERRSLDLTVEPHERFVDGLAHGRASMSNMTYQRGEGKCWLGTRRQIALVPLVALSSWIHASSKSVDPQPRRVLHIEYAAGVNLGADIELMIG